MQFWRSSRGSSFALTALGAWASLLLYGLVTEQLQGLSSEHRLQPTIVVLVSALFSAAVATATHRWEGHSGITPPLLPFRTMAMISGAYFLCHTFGQASLKHIIFPLQVVVKSCKSIPVLLGGLLLARNSYTWPEILLTVALSVSVAAFSMGGSVTFKHSSASEPHGLKAETPSALLGLLLASLSLVCDGIYGPLQDKLSREVRPTAVQLMFNVHVWESLWAAVASPFLGAGTVSAWAVLWRQPAVLAALAASCLLMSMGQSFLFRLQVQHGSLVVSLVTTGRKMLTVFLSTLWFEHSFTWVQWAAVFGVFGALAAQTLSSCRSKAKPMGCNHSSLHSDTKQA
eukprot:RCo030159